MQNTKVTIKDVAKAAGVTNGTVDRVLHNRGEVAHETKAKVMSVVERLGYKPNVYASMLARNKAHSIAVLMPSFSKGISGNWYTTGWHCQRNMPADSPSVSWSIIMTSMTWNLSEANAVRCWRTGTRA